MRCQARPGLAGRGQGLARPVGLAWPVLSWPGIALPGLATPDHWNYLFWHGITHLNDFATLMLFNMSKWNQTRERETLKRTNVWTYTPTSHIDVVHLETQWILFESSAISSSYTNIRKHMGRLETARMRFHDLETNRCNQLCFQNRHFYFLRQGDFCTWKCLAAQILHLQKENQQT